MLEKYTSVPAAARALTKSMMRAETIAATLGSPEGRKADLQRFLGLVLSKDVQAGLAAYLRSLKAKSSKK